MNYITLSPRLAWTGCPAHPPLQAAGSASRGNGESPWMPRRGIPQRDVDVNIVEFEVEGGLHVSGADDAHCRVVLPSHPPQFLAFGQSHLDPAVAAGNGAFERDSSGHFPNITTTARGRGPGMRAACSASTFILVAAWEQSLNPGSPGHRLSHRKGQLNADIAVRTTGSSDCGT